MRARLAHVIPRAMIGILLLTTAVGGAVEVIDPAEVAPGSTGVCLTEMDGGVMVEIPLTVIGTVGPWTPDGEIVLVRLDDERFERTGIIAGMSGSPVYVDGRLLGALAFGWSFSKEPIAGVTPFRHMLDLDQGTGAGVGPGPGRPELVELVAANRDHRLGNLLADWLLPQPGSALQSLPVAVTAAGSIGPSADGWLAESWRRLGWVSVPGGGAGPGENGALRPGSMVAAVLVDGDAVLAAGGTVTEVRGDEIWAFGHPFLGGGGFSLPMARAQVLAVLPSQASSFKFFSVGEAVGSFENDRSHGIWGVTGEVATMVPVRVTVDDRSYDFRSVRHPSLSPFLLGYLVQASQGAQGRLFGEQTIRARMRFDYAGGQAAAYDETFASGQAPEQVAALAAGLLAYLEGSFFEAPELERITISLSTDERLSGAELIDAVPERRVVRPGEELGVRIRFRPFRDEAFTRAFRIRVPAGIPDGRIDLVVADGASWSAYDLGMRPARPGSFNDDLRLVNGLLPSTSVVLALERRETGVAFDGGSMAMPPSLVVQSRTGLGPNLTTTSYAVSALVEEAMAMAVAGAVRIELQVSSAERVNETEAP